MWGEVKKMDDKIIVVEDIKKEKLEVSTEESDNWKNDVYGFECANWTCKC